mmetsp:Transcript_63625/g.189666  ORF Transcript_63625/g.189666 Transcript_63625/m.189666 type:complete len:828 (+) Transcript_63625:1660-4143(+)
MDRDKNNGNVPESTVISNNICFCLIKPTFDQCADPIYTQLRVNLPTWDAHRKKWQKAGSCPAACACSKPWFASISTSEAALSEGLLCQPVPCPELMVESDGGVVPKLDKPCCTRGECDDPDCLKARLQQLRACKTEFNDSTERVRHRKYSKMPRTRNDGTEYFEVELVYVLEPAKEFMMTMHSAIEAYVEHRRAHLWAVRQRKLLIEKLKNSVSLAQLAQTLGIAQEEVMQALRSADHPHHLTITDHDLNVFTDFAAKVKYVNASSSTCEHPEQGTLCIAVVLHSPAKRAVQQDTTEKEQLATGLEGVPISDPSKAPQHVKHGKRQREEVMQQSLQCDVFCGYSDESGNARFDQTLMRDIVAYYKLGHLVHAHAATHRGEPIPIGKDATSAKPSEYDAERLARLKAIHADQQKAKELALELVQEQAAAEAATTAAAAAPAQAAEGAKVLKKRATAGKTKVVATASEHQEAAVDTDRRGKLFLMRLLLKWSDGCGVQYVQREAALGTASMYGDIELLAKQAEDEAAKFGVIALHVVFEPHLFKYIRDAAGKIFSENHKKGVMGREVTISNFKQHYDYNAATMLAPIADEEFGFDMSFNNYFHVLYEKEDFIKLDADAVDGIKSWRFTAGGVTSRDIGTVGHGGGEGYGFHSQSHVCFCGGTPCKHIDFTGAPTPQKVRPCTQQKSDREQATAFVDTIDAGTPLASKGDVDDATSGGEPLWLSIAKGKLTQASKKFTVAGGSSASGTRTIAEGWYVVDIGWLVKVKTDSEGSVYYEEWSQPHGERTVLTKPKILCVEIDWLEVVDATETTRKRYVMSASTYQRLVDALK